ncbi:oxysterol binding family protein [Cavenderia fasciculata]|uniref:Oxysterol binding family protein n=1 Tax=Cavenderia fasciculata TaxID=261658 RepID=F4Q167_CACFS|nr:oxysterol binding family protein [Cavenderia fasciculata]EGG18568.1 oxysterol binding family protein [Cavenderia fasciculata]|eukprot:XP_004366472.1 oxysterol binding family protein [Cavenderia fasciculata]
MGKKDKKDKKKKELIEVEEVVPEELKVDHSEAQSPDTLTTSTTSTTTTTTTPVVTMNLDEIDDAVGSGSHIAALGMMLKNFKLNSDLTHMTVPGSFILPRSSLSFFAENYAAHFDLLIKANGIKDDKERMFQVYRYYMSTFKVYDDLTKKPLNPVLGETLQGSASLPDAENGAKQHVQVIAEQIQHHPFPISCTMAYNKEAGVSAAYFMPARTNFMGTYFKFTLDGDFVIKLEQHDEEYRISMATIAVRFLRNFSEFVGKTKMTSNKHDYRIKTTLYPKPLLYGSYNAMEATVYKGKEKLQKIKGCWDQEITINSEYKKNDHTTFFKRKGMTPSIIQTPHTLYETDSSNVWRGVFEAADKKAPKEMTREKSKVEEAQRKLAADRKAKGMPWVPIHFHKKGDDWYLNENEYIQ